MIEIIDGSSTAAGDSSRRVVISKEDRRALFDYFTFRPTSSRAKTPTAAATAAVETDEGAPREEAFPRDGGGVARPASGGVERRASRSRSFSLSSTLGRSTRHYLQRSYSAAESSASIVAARAGNGAASGAVVPQPLVVPAVETAMEEGTGGREVGESTVTADAVAVRMSGDRDETGTSARSSGGALAVADAELSRDSVVVRRRGVHAHNRTKGDQMNGCHGFPEFRYASDSLSPFDWSCPVFPILVI